MHVFPFFSLSDSQYANLESLSADTTLSVVCPSQSVGVRILLLGRSQVSHMCAAARCLWRAVLREAGPAKNISHVLDI